MFGEKYIKSWIVSLFRCVAVFLRKTLFMVKPILIVSFDAYLIWIDFLFADETFDIVDIYVDHP